MNDAPLNAKDHHISQSRYQWNATNLEDATAGKWIGRLLDPIVNIVIDTREVKQGSIFVALKGERYDAHEFVAQAAQNGAVAAVVDRFVEGVTIPQLLVQNTRLALGHLAAFHRQRFKNLKIAAITGSSGKTTTKEMLGSILNTQAATLITRGNLNNDIGVPLMLLELNDSHYYAVLELGANHIGEIQYTVGLVDPLVAGILNIGTAHLGEFGGRKAIARAKAEILLGLPNHGIAVLPAEDDFYPQLQTNAAAHRSLCFGANSDVYAANISLNTQNTQFNLHTPMGSIAITLPFAGQHNVNNALAATAFALALGSSLNDIKIGLEQAKGAAGRLEFKHLNNHVFIDDTYNANPHSVLAAAQVLLQQNGQKILVLGDIAELGSTAEQEHYKLGEALAYMPLDQLIVVGQYANAVKQGWDAVAPNKMAQAKAYAVKQLVINDLQQQLASQPQLTLLVKGSRSAEMETIIHALMELNI